MSLFGTMNWLYTWHNPKSDPNAETLALNISNLFLQGMLGTVAVAHRKANASVSRKSRARRGAVSRRAHE